MPTNGKRRTLTLSDEARGLWHTFSLRLESAMGEGGELEHLRDWGGKCAAAIARIASVMHVARYADSEPWARPVDALDMSNAIRIGEVLIRHALVAFDAMQADPHMDGARAILAWIQREGLQGFTRRDCHAAHKYRFPQVDNLDGALAILEERGYIRLHSQPVKVGRPSRTYEVNPVCAGASTKCSLTS